MLKNALAYKYLRGCPIGIPAGQTHRDNGLHTDSIRLWTMGYKTLPFAGRKLIVMCGFYCNVSFSHDSLTNGIYGVLGLGCNG